jgi:hypothetical protein
MLPFFVMPLPMPSSKFEMFAHSLKISPPPAMIKRALAAPFAFYPNRVGNPVNLNDIRNFVNMSWYSKEL